MGLIFTGGRRGSRGSFVSPGQNQTGYAVGEFVDVEIDQQAKWDIEELHVTQELGLVYGKNGFDGFNFQEDAFIHQ
jgi:hypothetical protein